MKSKAGRKVGIDGDSSGGRGYCGGGPFNVEGGGGRVRHAVDRYGKLHLAAIATVYPVKTNVIAAKIRAGCKIKRVREEKE